MAINRACLADTELVSIALGIDGSKKAKWDKPKEAWWRGLFIGVEGDHVNLPALLFIGMSFHFFMPQFSLSGVRIVTLHCKSNEKNCVTVITAKKIYSMESNKKLAVHLSAAWTEIRWVLCITYLRYWMLLTESFVLCSSSPTCLPSSFMEMWEKAIQLSKELADMYENKVFDYEGLGNLLVSFFFFPLNFQHAVDCLN